MRCGEPLAPALQPQEEHPATDLVEYAPKQHEIRHLSQVLRALIGAKNAQQELETKPQAVPVAVWRIQGILLIAFLFLLARTMGDIYGLLGLVLILILILARKEARQYVRL
jgi:hypothetical protein